MAEFNFSDAPAWVELKGKFDSTCTLLLSESAEAAGSRGRMKLCLYQQGNAAKLSQARIAVNSISGNFRIFLGADEIQVDIGENICGLYHLHLYRQSKVKIGDSTSSNNMRIVCDLSEVEIGKDCMFADGILIQSADQHGIVDLETGRIVNCKKRKISIGDHVWIGRESILLPDIAIGPGSVIGAGTVVTRDIPKTSVAAGVPARVIKKNTTWTRSPLALDAMSKMFVEQYHSPAPLSEGGDLIKA